MIYIQKIFCKGDFYKAFSFVNTQNRPELVLWREKKTSLSLYANGNKNSAWYSQPADTWIHLFVLWDFYSAMVISSFSLSMMSKT